jgi:hypothetical protein
VNDTIFLMDGESSTARIKGIKSSDYFNLFEYRQ